MKKMKLKRHCDPGHSWFAVKRELLKELNIFEKISGFSYQKGNTVYLEEDCDFSVFLKAYSEKNGLSLENWRTMFDYKESHTNNQSRIRSYASFNPKMVEKLEAGMNIMLYGKKYLVANTVSGVYVRSEDGMIYKLRPSQYSHCSEV